MARMAAPDMAECYFCCSGTLWVQEAVNFDESVELLLYPFTLDDVATWFADDFLKDLSPEGGPQAKMARFLLPELLLLLALQCEYGRGVHKKKGRLEPKDLWVGLDQLGQEAVIEERSLHAAHGGARHARPTGEKPSSAPKARGPGS